MLIKSRYKTSAVPGLYLSDYRYQDPHKFVTASGFIQSTRRQVANWILLRRRQHDTNLRRATKWNLQFTGKLTEAELGEVQKLTLPKMYWPKLFLANWYGFGLIAAITWATISGFLGQTKPNWRAMGVIWLVIAGIVLWSVFRTKQETARDLVKLNATLPDQVNFTNDGVKLVGPDGASAFLPWTHFKRWREGKRVMLVETVEGNRVVILPVAQYSEVERQPIRQFLQSSIPSSSH